jgi:hypothetical protein
MGNKRRRELAYESDIIARIDWTGIGHDRVRRRTGRPTPGASMAAQLHLGLELLRAQQQNPNMEPRKTTPPHSGWTARAWCAGCWTSCPMPGLPGAQWMRC